VQLNGEKSRDLVMRVKTILEYVPTQKIDILSTQIGHMDQCLKSEPTRIKIFKDFGTSGNTHRPFPEMKKLSIIL
jgi:hypothetical protein